MNILLPKTINAASFGPGTTIPEVDASRGEVLWVSGISYVVGDRRVWEGYTHECVLAVSGAPANTYPPGSANASKYWKRDEGAPTNRMAPFDKYLFTKARAVHSLTYELKGVFVDGVVLYGVEGDVLEIAVTGGPGGPNLIDPLSMDLWQQAYGEAEYLFGDLQRGTHYTLKGIPIHPDQRITITVRRNNADVEAAVGYISIGNQKTLLDPTGTISAVEDGAEVETKDYGYTEDKPDGTYEDVEGRKAKNITVSCVVRADQAPLVDSLLTQIAGKVVAIEVSNMAKFSHIATVGKVTGRVRSSGGQTARAEIQVKGNV
ncbi:hypothetical protein [Delftia acidovorans]|uniref:hypothetical protein n=1 Tax=Delftia acidovorans TaxID=80866 RepID=UPI002430BA5E|nr:hypothetical protein [Delftia acidovorans]